MVYDEIKKYAWKHGKGNGVSAQVAGEVMEKIERRDGQVTKEAFLEESRPEDSPTHNLFEWDDTIAAEQYRLHQSQLAILDIVVTIEKDETKQKAPAFVNVVVRNEKAKYNSVDIVMADEEKRKMALKNAFAELTAFENKYGMYQELSGVFTEAHRAERMYG